MLLSILTFGISHTSARAKILFITILLSIPINIGVSKKIKSKISTDSGYVYSNYRPLTTSQKIYYTNLANDKLNEDEHIIKIDLKEIRNANTYEKELYYKNKYKMDEKNSDKDVDNVLYWDGQS